MAKSQRAWFALGWLSGWSWTERLIVLALGAAPILALAYFGRDGGWFVGLLAAAAFIALQVIVYRHGGWQLLGPHFYYDVVRLARRGRSTALRVVYILAMLAGLAIVFHNTPIQNMRRPNDFARASENFAFALFIVQNIAVLVLTPAYLGSAITEEKERRTLELLFTTHLTNTEIILGKLTSRIIHLVGFVLAGLSILSMIQFWGGVDMLLIAGNIVNTILNIVSVGSVCLLASVLMRTVTSAVMTAYAVILPIGFCCVLSLRGFPFVLQDARSGGSGNVTVQDLGVLCVVHLVIVTGFLSLAIAALREHEPLGAVLPPAPERYDVSDGPTKVGRKVAPGLDPTAVQAEPILVAKSASPMPPPTVEPPRFRDHEPETEFAIPYSLPPITDNALLWKERFVGGPPWFFSPVVLVPALPFLVTGFLVLAFWFLRSLFLNRDEFRNAVEGWSIVLRFLYYCTLGAYALGVGFRAASSVARERQQQTLDPLLLLPIERREILWAKLLGCLIRGWPWLTLLALNLAFGTFMGAYHPLSATWLTLAPWPLVFFVAGLGLFLSVEMATVLRANLIFLVFVTLLAAMSFLLPLGAGPLTYLEPFTFSWFREGMFLDDMMNPARINPKFASVAVLIGYIVVGAALQMAAFRRFDNRASQADS